jgi:hypothetical protein
VLAPRACCSWSNIGGAAAGRFRTWDTLEERAADGEQAVLAHRMGNLPHLQLEALRGDGEYPLISFHFSISHQ